VVKTSNASKASAPDYVCYSTVSTRLKKEGGTRDCFTQMSMVGVDIRFSDGIGCGHTCEILTRVCCGERY
jgi:hypothetical protein